MPEILRVRGTRDLVGIESEIFDYIIKISSEVANLHCYKKLYTPIIEKSNIFDRTLGESSDIVSKELYSFLDKGGNALSLRPEFTAGIVRAFITGGWLKDLPLKFFSYGPVFRYDRPQSGRQRQFHQLNFEYLGSSGPFKDAELIKTAYDLCVKLEIDKYVTLELNSLGCDDSRKNYISSLREYYTKYKNDLSEDSKLRLLKNPMRILDSKDIKDKEINQTAPLISDYYTRTAREYFENLTNHLTEFGIKYKINKSLVRGLDYYCHTAFEFVTDKLGSQNAVLAGGRYDKLSTIMGGPDLSAAGFAAGIERIMLMREYNIKIENKISILPLDSEFIKHSINLLEILHKNNISSIIEQGQKIDKLIKKSLKQGANYVIFIGKKERDANKYTLKNLKSGLEIFCSIEELIKNLDN